MTDKQQEGSELDQEYIPAIMSLPETNDPFKTELRPVFDSIVEYPNFSLGFHHFMHQSRGKLVTLDQFKGKKKVYLVLNKFERLIDDYKEDLNTLAIEYFGLKNEPKILNRSFFKMWEMLMYFDLVPTDKANFVSAHLAETPGSFIQATMFYRDMFGKKGVSKNDKYHAVSLSHPDYKDLTRLDDDFFKYYSKEKRVQMSSNVREKADLITADGAIEWENDMIQEQEAERLILSEIVTALNMQAKGGNFVCKFFECFTEMTVQLIAILSQFYDNVFVCKPLTSRMSNSERFLVCVNYKDPKDAGKKISQLEAILDQASKEKGKYIKGIFKNYQMDKKFQTALTWMNIQISNKQFLRVNEIIDFVEKQNYRGDTYQTRRQMQIDATKYWSKMFFLDAKEFDKKRKDVLNQTLKIIKENQEATEKLTNRIH